MIYQLWYGTSGWTFPFDREWLNDRTWAPDVLVTEGAKESAAMSMTLFSEISQFQQHYGCFLFTEICKL